MVALRTSKTKINYNLKSSMKLAFRLGQENKKFITSFTEKLCKPAKAVKLSKEIPVESKPRRGRPPKQATAILSKTISPRASKNALSPTKKGVRGRPSKKSLADKASAERKSQITPIKRRGRPPKTCVPDSQVSESRTRKPKAKSSSLFDKKEKANSKITLPTFIPTKRSAKANKTLCAPMKLGPKVKGRIVKSVKPNLTIAARKASAKSQTPKVVSKEKANTNKPLTPVQPCGFIQDFDTKHVINANNYAAIEPVTKGFPPSPKEKLPCPPQPRAPAPLTEYEKQRLETIRQNQAFLESLSLGAGFGMTASFIAPSKVEPIKSAVKPLVSKKKEAPLFEPRKSLRVQNMPAPKPLPLFEAAIKKPAHRAPKKRKFIQFKSRTNWDLPVDMKRQDLELSKKGKVAVPALAKSEALKICQKLSSLKLSDHDNYIHTSFPPERHVPREEEVISKLQELRLVTEPPVKLMHPIPTTLDVHSDSRRLLIAMGNREGQVALWDATDLLLGNDGEDSIASGGLLTTEAPHFLHQPHEQPILGLKFQPGHASRLLHAGGDGSLRSMDIVKGIDSGVCQLSVPSDSITGLDVKSATPYSAYFITSHGFLGHHDLRTTSHAAASSLHHIEPSAMRLWCLAQNPLSPHLMAVGSSERTLSLWDMRYMSANPTPITALGFAASVTSLDWDPRGTRLLSLSYDSQLRFYDVDELVGGEESHSVNMTGHHPHHGDPWRKGVPVQARFHPDPALDGCLAASGAEGPQVNFYSSPTGRSLGSYSGRNNLPAASPGIVAFHPSATLDSSSPLGSGMVLGTLSGRVLILV
ncbi:WD repeat-containing protein 76 [Entomophthora muscae]|uniref:WD repeat-containing protein 76 n=1 Tax=Entomophthora muscae TaxID=34485 RepID=A0ACC2S1C7_9FUNG|nr:WD repeat-containing protein 76 [Entomophthora muscae]